MPKTPPAAITKALLAVTTQHRISINAIPNRDVRDKKLTVKAEETPRVQCIGPAAQKI